MRICRILTNNALVVLDEKGKEQIVCGKGIGYKKRPGDNVDDKLVETVYVKEGDQSFEQIRRTLEALPEEYLLLAQHIVEAANVSLNMKLNPVMAVSLADHLFYAIQRFLEGTPIANSLTWEIKRFYQKEYEVGNYVLCGGDFNHDLKASDGDEEEHESWAYPFPREALPEHFSFCIDALSEEERNAMWNSARNADMAYVPDVTYTVTLDGFIVSDNIECLTYENVDTGYSYSDHDPVYMEFKLK